MRMRGYEQHLEDTKTGETEQRRFVLLPSSPPTPAAVESAQNRRALGRLPARYNESPRVPPWQHIAPTNANSFSESQQSMGTVMSATFLDTLSADFLGAVLVMPQPLPIPFTATSGVEQGPAVSKVDAAILRSHASTSGLPFARPARSTFPSADQLLARELMRPPKYGGHSKRDKLGTIAESWGPDPSDPLRIGLFQHEPEPPSPTASPRPPSVDLSFK